MTFVFALKLNSLLETVLSALSETVLEKSFIYSDEQSRNSSTRYVIHVILALVMAKCRTKVL